MPSDLEMSGSTQSDTEPDTEFDTEVAYRRGPPQLTHKGNLYTRKEHQDNTRAYTKASIIWQFGDECARTVNGQQKKYWRCGLCNRTTILVMTDNSSSGLRHLKKNHKIDKDGQRQTSQTMVTAAFAAAATAANLVTRFKASTFRYLLIRWIVTMHIALSCVESESFRTWVLYVAPALDKYLVTSGDTIRRWVLREFERQRLEIKKH